MRLIGIAACAAILGLAANSWAGSAGDTDAAKLANARDLIGDYYGDRSMLQQAAVLVGEVLQKNPKSADAWVEAARLTAKDGFLFSDKFAPGTMDAYRSLVNKALVLDPGNPAALSLKAEIYLASGDYPDALAAIRLGQKREPDNPWLKLKLATYYDGIRDPHGGFEELESIITPRCDSDPNYRRACVNALLREVRRFALPENAELVRSLAKQVLQYRHPKDAWTLGDLGLYFAYADLQDEAIAYERQALSIMRFGVARTNLAALLYAKAADLKAAGKPNDQLLAEADALGVSEEAVLEWYKQTSKSAQAHAPNVIRLFESRGR